MNFIGNAALKGVDLVLYPSFGLGCGFLSLGKTAVGVGATALSVLSLGRKPNINSWADMTNNSADILYDPIMGVFCGLNTQTKCHGQPILNKKIATPCWERGKIAAKKGNNWTARAHFTSFTLVSLAARIGDFAIGVIATAIALCCLGQWTWMNGYAIQQIGVTGIINDVAIGLRGLVNPQQFVPVKR